ncbi:phosphate acetyltransferase [Rhodobacteraceae bacterium MYP1-1]|uniref:Phosphate acetyltransferase n=2 Tax=Halocynthiibacter styelae TaxID=2761955 RepID=A0A8J7IRR5_9RHOB|nr:phosphate acetyltransferase [Paenihalocynthiibacter styelae]
MTPVELLQSKKLATRPVISLSEGSDPRIVAGALAAHDLGIADVILVGDTADIQAGLTDLNLELRPGVEIHDPKTSELTAGFSDAYHEMRKHKGVDADKARTAVETPLVYAAMLVREGHANGTLGGAVFTTSNVVRAAIQVIGVAPDAAMISSFFLMFPPSNATPHARAMLYSDGGLVIDPSSDELVSIAQQSAASAQALLRVDPKIAMLSFSTKGSAKHPAVTKVNQATEALRAARPDLAVEGELQFDAAFVPDIADRKAPGSDVAGHANVMIFPNLDAGNIAYKITQRLGGYAAIGPILQGVAKPANDLSRGCSAEDVTEMIAVTALQGLKS